MMTNYSFRNGVVHLESDIAAEAMFLSRLPADEKILDRKQTDDGYQMTIRCEPPVCPECNEVTRNYGDFCWKDQVIIGLHCDICCGISGDQGGDDFGDDEWDDDLDGEDVSEDDLDIDLENNDSAEIPGEALRRDDQFYSCNDKTPIWFRNDVTWHKKFGANGE